MTHTVLDRLGELSLGQVAFLVFLIMIVDTTAVVGLAIPSDAVLLTTAGALGIGGIGVLVPAAALGSLLGWSASFLLGRVAGDHVRLGRLGRLVRPERWGTAERLLAGRAGNALVLVQFLPVVNALIPLIAGTLRMPYSRFLRLAAVSTVTWATVYSLLGSVASVAPTTVNPFVALVAVGLPGLLIGSLALRLVSRRSSRDGHRPPGPGPREAGPGLLPHSRDDGRCRSGGT